MRATGFAPLALARNTSFDVFTFLRGAGLVDFALVLRPGLPGFAFTASGRLDSLVFVRIVGFDVFALARTAGRGEFISFFILCLVTPAPLPFVALRAGAFDEGERLAISFERADFPDNARPFAEDFAGLRREVELVRDRLTPLTVGSLMRGSMISKKVTQTK